jgi:hypothetical protein
MPAAAGNEAGRPRSADITASSIARTVTVGSLSPVEAELVEAPTDLDSDEVPTLTSARAVFIGRLGGVGTGRESPVGTSPGTKAAADGRRVGQARGGGIATAAGRGGASAMRPRNRTVASVVEAAKSTATAGAAWGARCQSPTRGSPEGRSSPAPPSARDAEAADERPAISRARSFRTRSSSHASISARDSGEEL